MNLAPNYSNIRDSVIAREELFVTTKLDGEFHGDERAVAGLDECLRQLGLEYVDLLLIHWPLPTLYDGDYVSTWKAMANLLDDGRLRSVGVSSFQSAHLDRIIAETGIVPVVNQIEVHPGFNNTAARDASARHGIAVEAFSPLGQGKALEDEVISGIAARTGKTCAQAVLRWHIQQGRIVFPKTMHPERMQENLDLFDFDLPPAEVAAIDALERGEAGRIGPNPDNRLLKKFNTAKKMVPAPQYFQDSKNSSHAMLFFGTTLHAAEEALDILKSEGSPMDAIRNKAFPFADEVAHFIDQYDKVFVDRAKQRCAI